MKPRYGVGILLLVAGMGSCVDPVPVVRVGVAAAPTVAATGASVQVTVTLTNEGPGDVLAAVGCPSLLARDSTGAQVMVPGTMCLAAASNPFPLRSGEASVFVTSWPGTSPDGPTVPPGEYYLEANAAARSGDGMLLDLVTSPASVTIRAR